MRYTVFNIYKASNAFYISMTVEQANRQAKKIVKFYYSIALFFIVNVFLYFIDFIPDGRIDWAYWVTLGWGLGLLIEGFGVFFGAGLEEKIAKDLMEKEGY